MASPGGYAENAEIDLKRVLAAALALTIGATGLALAAPRLPLLWDAKERLPKPDLSKLPRLRFLTTTDFPPFNFLDGNGRLSGLHIDLARALCAELDIADRCQIQAVPWFELEQALARGDGEAILAGVAVTSANRDKYSFTRPYMVLPARFVVPGNSPLKEPIAAQIQDKRVGVIAGTAHEKMLRALFGKVDVATYPSQDLLLADLKAGKLDAVFGDGMRLAAWLPSSEAADCCRFAGGPYVSPQFLGDGLAIATSKSSPELAAALNYAIEAVSVKGTLTELYLRYFPVDFF